MTGKESELWLKGWRPTRLKYPRKYWADPQSGTVYELDEAYKIMVSRT